jgi:hypothetical protein
MGISIIRNFRQILLSLRGSVVLLLDLGRIFQFLHPIHNL